MCANILRFFYPERDYGNRRTFTEAQRNHCLCMYYSAVKKQDLFDRVPRPPRAGGVTLSYARQTLARMAGITGQSPEGTFSTTVRNAIMSEYARSTETCFRYGQNSLCATECKWLRCYNHFSSKYLKVPGEHCKRTTKLTCGSDHQCTPDSSDGKTGCQTGNVCLCSRHRINECVRAIAIVFVLFFCCANCLFAFVSFVYSNARGGCRARWRTAATPTARSNVLQRTDSRDPTAATPSRQYVENEQTPCC